MNLQWQETAHNKWRLFEREVDSFGWRRERTLAFVHEYRRHHKRRVRATVYPHGTWDPRLTSKQFKTAEEAKAWAVAICQLSE